MAIIPGHWRADVSRISGAFLEDPRQGVVYLVTGEPCVVVLSFLGFHNEHVEFYQVQEVVEECRAFPMAVEVVIDELFSPAIC